MMRDFDLEVFFSQWEFSARHHMTASDAEAMSMSELLDLAKPEGRDAFENLWLGYTETWGAPELRERIAATYYGLDASNILCHAGAGEGIYAAMRVLLAKEDHAIVVVPNYQSAETVPLDLCSVSGVTLQEEDDWQLDIDAVAATIRPETRLISINYPHNPTGTTLEADRLEALIALCRKHDIILFSDEVYRGIELNPDYKMPQIADIYEKGFSLNVMSKAYGLPGLRIGWLASQDQALLQKIERYKHFLSICNSGPSEHLAMIALAARDKILARNKALVARNLDLLDSFFGDYSDLFSWKRSRGGCVAYPRYLGSEGVEAFCRKLIEDSGILLLPSSIYRSELCEAPVNHFRIGFGRDKVFLNGLEAMKAHMAKHYR